ncbi:hypothetical protein LXA43DRAFT_892850 [Ganoderma leucocontextum]|nr:hypothetical protein LXA43DRAFT_892850 [Ganoderma leucocontextum]
MALAVRSTPSSSTLVRRASTSNPSPGAIVAIVAGVTLFFLLVAVLLHLPEVKAFYERIVTGIRRRGLATPAKDRQWDVLAWNEASAIVSTAASTPEPFATHTARMRDVSIHLVGTAEHASLPPLRPNRRPPSGVLDPPSARPAEPAPPLPRLEPLRRKPSKSRRPAALTLPAREPTPPETPPKEPPPLPSPSPSSSSASEKRAVPSSTGTVVIRMPKPVRAELRPISAYTSASTVLADMPLLKPSARPHESKDARLSRVLTVANQNEAYSPGGPFLPPIPPVPPIPPIYLPQPTSEKEPPRPLPAKPLDSLSGPSLRTTSTPTHPTPQSTTQSPTSPASASEASSPALRRQNSSSSTRSPRLPARKPVPPLVIPFSNHSRSPSEGDAMSSIWGAPESGWRKNSLASTALDSLVCSRWGSPVPSSSASQMYRTRDSGMSEWTWTRPLEDWEKEKEQFNLRRKASAGDLSPPHGQRGVGAVGGGEGRMGHKASASMGEMRAMRGVVPDVPKVPTQYRP